MKYYWHYLRPKTLWRVLSGGDLKDLDAALNTDLQRSEPPSPEYFYVIYTAASEVLDNRLRHDKAMGFAYLTWSFSFISLFASIMTVAFSFLGGVK